MNIIWYLGKVPAVKKFRPVCRSSYFCGQRDGANNKRQRFRNYYNIQRHSLDGYFIFPLLRISQHNYPFCDPILYCYHRVKELLGDILTGVHKYYYCPYSTRFCMFYRKRRKNEARRGICIQIVVLTLGAVNILYFILCMRIAKSRGAYYDIKT